MRRIIFTRPDGGLSVVTPVINTHPVREQITAAQAEARAWGRLPANAINPQWVSADRVPADRTFRAAWTAGLGSVEHDMEKCRAIHRDHLRTLRKPLLEALDVNYMRAMERGASAEMHAIAEQKQALRDVTASPDIDTAPTPQALKAVMPACLRP